MSLRALKLPTKAVCLGATGVSNQRFHYKVAAENLVARVRETDCKYLENSIGISFHLEPFDGHGAS